MPDWSYQTTFKPLLFRLPPATARDLTLTIMGGLARLPFGGPIIDFLGHMRADPRLMTEVAGIQFPTAVGLGLGVDVDARALPALERFGFGFLSVGITDSTQSPSVKRLPATQAIGYRGLPTTNLETLTQYRREWNNRTLPYIVQLACQPEATPAAATAIGCQWMAALAGQSDLFAVMTLNQVLAGRWHGEEWIGHIAHLLAALKAYGRPLFLSIPTNADCEAILPLLEQACALGVAGVIVQGAIDKETNEYWIACGQFEATLAIVKCLRQRWPQGGNAGLSLIVSGGIHEPHQALTMRSAGADLVLVDSGLVYSGPGLPKRINEAMLYAKHGQPAAMSVGSTQSAPQVTSEKWFWTTLLALAMLAGGLLALFLGAFGVILPYDEAFVGMSRSEFAAINERLLPFMAHDRITLAGTMLALGIFYLSLSYYGIRRGVHWASIALLYSALVGFASFFLFLGFGYFDPFHAFVTVVLLQLLLMGMHSDLSPYREIALPSLHNDLNWRRSLWSQYLFILQGIGIIGAGLYISIIGITVVFVAEDLAFMQTTAAALYAINPQLVPLVAHDRATLGGMLISSGIAIFLSALWGYRPGERWLWRGLLLGCCVAYGATLLVHLTVGYTDLLHLTPVFAGLGLTFVASWLSYGYLHQEKS